MAGRAMTFGSPGPTDAGGVYSSGPGAGAHGRQLQLRVAHAGRRAGPGAYAHAPVPGRGAMTAPGGNGPLAPAPVSPLRAALAQRCPACRRGPIFAGLVRG